MSGAIITGIQLFFDAAVLICLLIALHKLERIGGFLAEQVQWQKQITVALPSEKSFMDSHQDASVSDAEIAAVMAVIAKLMPDKQVTAVRMISK